MSFRQAQLQVKVQLQIQAQIEFLGHVQLQVPVASFEQSEQLTPAQFDIFDGFSLFHRHIFPSKFIVGDVLPFQVRYPIAAAIFYAILPHLTTATVIQGI